MEDLRYNTLSEFAEGVRCELGKRYGVTVCIKEATKINNAKYTYIAITDSEVNISPAIYLEEFYAIYREEGFESALTKIWNCYEKNKMSSDIDVSFISEYGNIRDRLGAKIINYDMNEEMLINIPHVKFLDLAVIAYIEVGDLVGKDVSASITVNMNILNMWDIDKDSLIHDALDNTKDDVKISDMAELIKRLWPEIYEEYNADKLVEYDAMYVMSNKTGTNGAVALLNIPMLKKFALEKDLNTLYIIPCSVHEIILMGDAVNSVEYLKEVVAAVNKTELQQTEILSNNVYVYNVKDNDIKIA